MSSQLKNSGESQRSRKIDKQIILFVSVRKITKPSNLPQNLIPNELRSNLKLNLDKDRTYFAVNFFREFCVNVLLYSPSSTLLQPFFLWFFDMKEKSTMISISRASRKELPGYYNKTDSYVKSAIKKRHSKYTQKHVKCINKIIFFCHFHYNFDKELA